MIHIYNGSNFKVKKYKTSDHLIKALDVDYFNKQKEFDKILERGDDVYCCLTPKMDEDDDNDLIWDVDPNKLEKLYWLIAEEI